MPSRVRPGGGLRGHGRGPVVAWGTIALVSLVAAVLAGLSDGNYMDDDVTHYLIARTAWERPSLLTDEWGRPGFTIPYALVAWIGSTSTGFSAARLLSVAIMAATMGLTWQAARGLRVPYAWATPALLAGMPLYFHLGYTTTTETIAALYAITGTWLLLYRRYVLAAIVLALLPATRHEMIVFLVPVGLWLLWHRRFVAALLLGWAEVAWNLIVWLMHWQPPGGKLPIQRFFSTSEPGMLGYGSPIHYLGRWWDLCGIIIAGLSLAGALWMLRREWRIRRSAALTRPTRALKDCPGTDDSFGASRHPGTTAGQDGGSHRRRIRLMVAGGALGLVGLHTYLYMVNTHLSGGYARFLIPAAPWMAICAAWGAVGLVRMMHALRRPQRDIPPRPASTQSLPRLRLSLRMRWTVGCLLFAAAFAVVPATVPHVSHPIRAVLAGVLLALLVRPRPWLGRVALGLCLVVMLCEWLFLCRPHRLTAEQVLLRDTLAELRAVYPDHHITGSTPWVEYFLGAAVNLPRWHDPLPWDPQKHPVTTLYVLERTHGSGKHDVLESLEHLPHRVVMTKALDGQTHLTVYERLE